MKKKFSSPPEAREWIAAGKGKHFIGELPADESLELVAELYGMGATAVLVESVASNAGLSAAYFLIVKLPGDRESRRMIYEWEQARRLAMGYEDAPVDTGAAELRLWFD